MYVHVYPAVPVPTIVLKNISLEFGLYLIVKVDRDWTIVDDCMSSDNDCWQVSDCDVAAILLTPSPHDSLANYGCDFRLTWNQCFLWFSK